MNNKNLYKFLDIRNLLIQDLEDIKFAQEASGRALFLYSRFMSIKYRNFYHSPYFQPVIPCYAYYLYFFDSAFLRAKQIYNTNLKSNSNYRVMEWPKSGCLELDIIAEKYIKSKLGLSINFKNRCNTNSFNKDRQFWIHPITFIDFLKDIIRIYRPINKKRKTNNFSKVTNDKAHACLYISQSYEAVKRKKVYGFLEKILKNFFCSKKSILLSIHTNDLGISNLQRISCILKSLYEFFNKLKKIEDVKLSNLYYLFFINSTQKFTNNIENYIKENNIKVILNSYHDYTRLSRYFAAARSVQIPFFNFDYSLGFPLTSKNFSRYDPASRKYGDILFANSSYRMDQYLQATNYLDKSPQIILNDCPQMTYALANPDFYFKDILKISGNRLKIGIVDSTLKKDICPTEDDVKSLVKFLSLNSNEIFLLLQSKSGGLEKLFDSSVDRKYMQSARFQGDLSILSYADIIISLSWQGTALKASTYFKKPLIFYSFSGFNYKRMIFNNNLEKNRILISNLEKIWFSNHSFPKLFNKLNNKDCIENIKHYSSKVLDLVNCEKNQPFDVNFQNYLKNNYIDYLNK